MILSYKYEPLDQKIEFNSEKTKAGHFKVFGKDVDDNNVFHLCGLNGMQDIRRMLRKSEFMVPFAKNNEGTLQSKRATNEDRLLKLRKVAHRLNRKGIHPTRLNHTVKTADSFEDTDVLEDADANQEGKFAESDSGESEHVPFSVGRVGF